MRQFRARNSNIIGLSTKLEKVKGEAAPTRIVSPEKIQSVVCNAFVNTHFSIFFGSLHLCDLLCHTRVS
jgi:hypothetical protein